MSGIRFKMNLKGKYDDCSLKIGDIIAKYDRITDTYISFEVTKFRKRVSTVKVNEFGLPTHTSDLSVYGKSSKHDRLSRFLFRLSLYEEYLETGVIKHFRDGVQIKKCS